MQPYVERMMKEQEDLSDKCEKAIKFANSINFLKLDEENRYLLSTQINVMLAYNEILKRRIKINGGH